ncbi:MAG: methyltransferase domain-containing protein [Nitrospirae bacterium]|nr:methyltransferase domain-containing protein [Nitrospirota bacterium]MBF0542669.1 methyltransferase domain-containing protein [Nitrospirota bacterium]
MKLSHITLLKCIKCDGEIALSSIHPNKIEKEIIEFGILSCIDCGALYPIIKGVGVFFKKEFIGHYLNEDEKKICNDLGLFIDKEKVTLNQIQQKQLDAASNWSYQWTKTYDFKKDDFINEGFLKEETFFEFIPIETEKIKNKTIIVWCGGKGREAFHLIKYNPEVLIVNEIGDEIYGIPQLLGYPDNLMLIRCDMQQNPIRLGSADYSICDHALQHVADHKMGFKVITDVLKPNGIIIINAYSYENNFLMVYIIEPLKVIFHKLSLKTLERIAFIPAMIVYILIHLFYVPANKILSKQTCNKIPLFDHMIFWSKVSFKWIDLACFDLIHAPISYHFKKEEFIKMARDNNATIKTLNNTHGTTWTFIAHAQR